MYRKIMIAGATAAVIVGAGGAALAATDTGSTTSGSATNATSSTAAHHGKHGKDGKRRHDVLRRVEHGELVLHKKDGTVTRQFARGTVTDVSPSDITVRSLDGHSTTFTVTSKTKVNERQDGKRTSESISAVKTGDRVFVGGTGAGTPTAVRIFDAGVKKASTTS